MPSARNALQNTLSRAPLHGRWWVNDPDCLLLRPTTQLTQPEMQSIATAIALTGGSLMLSDNLATLPSDRRHIAQLLLPVIGKRPWVIDWIDATTPSKLRVDLDGPAGAWHLLAQFNWAEEPADLKFRFDEYQLSALSAFTAHSFWTQENYSQTLEGFHVSNVPPHGVAMLALRPVKFGEPGYVGSNLHITQGFEIGGWEAGYGKIHLQLSLPRKAEGQVVLSIPRPPTAATIDGRPIRQVEGGFPSQGCYRFNVAFDHRAVLEVSY